MMRLGAGALFLLCYIDVVAVLALVSCPEDCLHGP